MNELLNQDLYVCGCCKRELPLECFYITRYQERDGYCKDCRRKSSSGTYSTGRKKHNRRRKNYPIITEIDDREVRMELIKHALLTVRDSKERRRRKLWEID